MILIVPNLTRHVLKLARTIRSHTTQIWLLRGSPDVADLSHLASGADGADGAVGADTVNDDDDDYSFDRVWTVDPVSKQLVS